MRYLITLTPLEPFLFGGENTFGQLGDKENGTYIARSRLFPQQSAILGMLKKEIMTQAGVLTRKVRGEWVDPTQKQRAKQLAGEEKFDLFATTLQNFGVIKEISPIFLQKDGKTIIKQADIQKFQLIKKDDNYLLQGFTAKDDIFDNFVQIDLNCSYKTEDIFSFQEQTLNQKEARENSLYKKISCKLHEGFVFGFYLECDFELQDSIITLGADRSSFKMKVLSSNARLTQQTEHCLLLSDAYITIPLKQNCEFAITSEISFQSLQNKKHVFQKNSFKKSQQVYLYEKGSIIIKPSKALLDNLNNTNLQQIGYNIFTTGENR